MKSLSHPSNTAVVRVGYGLASPIGFAKAPVFMLCYTNQITKKENFGEQKICFCLQLGGLRLRSDSTIGLGSDGGC